MQLNRLLLVVDNYVQSFRRRRIPETLPARRRHPFDQLFELIDPVTIQSLHNDKFLRYGFAEKDSRFLQPIGTFVGGHWRIIQLMSVESVSL